MADEEDLEGEGAQPSGAGKAGRRDSMSNLMPALLYQKSSRLPSKVCERRAYALKQPALLR